MSTAINPLSRLRGRFYTRLSPTQVEVFCITECVDCNTRLSFSRIRLTEPSDSKLNLSGITRAILPENGHSCHTGSDAQEHRCTRCYRRWLDPFLLRTELRTRYLSENSNEVEI